MNFEPVMKTIASRARYCAIAGEVIRAWQASTTKLKASPWAVRSRSMSASDGRIRPVLEP
jgi:hypothetical protein